MATKVGEIVYQVQMDVRQLLTSQREIEQRLNRLDGSFDRTTQAVGGTERSMSSLSKVAASLAGYLSVAMIGSYADAWTSLNNKLANSIKLGESQADVMKRIFDISQATQSSLNGTATLYARLESATRSYNTSVSDLSRLTTVVNQALSISGASTQEAESAIIQLSQAMSLGVLRGQDFNSVSSSGSRLMKALGDSLGVTQAELRKMAGEGKITTDVVVNGLLSQGDKIGAEFAKTTVTISQGLLVAGNNLTKFFGENSTVKTFSAAFRDSVIKITENLDGLASVLVLVSTVIGSRYAGALALATKEKVKKVIASRAEAAAESEVAKVSALRAAGELRAAAASKQRAIDEIRLAQLMKSRAVGDTQVAAAEAKLSAARQAATAITARYNAALIANAAAQNAAGAAARNASIGVGRALGGALGLIGGPVGLAVAAASAIFYFSQQSKEARENANNLADSLNSLVEKFRSMSRSEISATIAKLRQSIPELTDAVSEAEAEFKRATNKVDEHERSIAKWGRTVRFGREAVEALGPAQDRLAIATDELDKANKRLSQTNSVVALGQAQLNGEIKQGIELLSRQQSILPSAAQAWKAYGLNIDSATRSKQAFNAQSLQLDFGGEDGQKLKTQLQRELDLSGLKGEAKVKLQVEHAAADAGVTDKGAIDKLKELAVAKHKNDEEQKKLDKSNKASTKTAKEATDAIKKQAEEIKRLNAGFKEGTIEQARFDAVAALGDKASKAQIAQAIKLGEEKFNLERKAADKRAVIDNDILAKAKETSDKELQQLDRQLASGDISFEQSQKRRLEITADYSKKIAEESSKDSVNFVADNRGQIDPIQQLANENARKLALMESYQKQEQAIIQESYNQQQITYDQYTSAKQATDAQYLMLRTAQEAQFQEQQIAAQWQLLSQQGLGYEMLTGAIDSFAGNASNALTGIITGSMSADEALRSMGSTILNTLTNSFVQMGVEMVKNFILSQTLGKASAMAAAATATAGGAAALAAWTPAAIAASIATLGTASATGLAAFQTAIAGGQMTSQLSSMGTQAVGMAYGGARYNGGPVDASKMYRVGEGGKPEIFKASNGNQYMIPGDNGRVIPNKSISGGASGGVTVHQENNFTIHTTNGIQDADIIKLKEMMKTTAMMTIKDQQRGGGMLSR